VRIPLWAALALPAAAYLVRSLVIRGGDFAPDVPQDIIALVVFTVGVTAAVVVRRRITEDDSAFTDAGAPSDVGPDDRID
jgi:hypothetical protein